MIYLHAVTATSEEVDQLQDTEKELVLQLKTCMERLIKSPDGFGYPCSVLLWVLMLGGLCAKQHEDRTWFLNRLQTTMETAQILTWIEARALLKDMPWVQTKVDEMLKLLCLGVGNQIRFG